MDIFGYSTLFGTVLASFITLVTVMLRQQDKQNKLLSSAINNQASATTKLARETKKGNQQAEARNGHLAEISQQGTDRIIEKMDETSGLLSVNTKKVAMQAENVRVDLKAKDKN